MAEQINLDTFINATRETNSIEFKEKFDVSSLQDWCEIIKDIVAIANSGGGVLLFGVNDKGVTIDSDIKPILD